MGGGKIQPGKARNLLNLRRLVQAVVFAAFIFLLLRTEYRGSAEIRYPVNAFFQLDPYLAAAVMLAAKRLVSMFWPALIVVAGTLVLGRVFCGWFCPMGSFLDFIGRWRKGSPHPVSPALGPRRHLKYYLLAGTLAAAVFGFQAAWFLDPFSLLARSFSVSVIPAANLALTSFFDFIYINLRPLAFVTEPIYKVLGRTVLTFEQQHFLWGMASLFVLGLVMAGELIRPRFWCRYLCPLGAAVSLLSVKALLKRRVNEGCIDCRACYDRCPKGLIDEANHRGSSYECSMCLDCRMVCPHGAVEFNLEASSREETAPRISRRRVLGGLAAGVLGVPFFRLAPGIKLIRPTLLRPPGSEPEREFLKRCVRCGSCMKVCMGNAIHPALTEGGLEGMMTPIMYFRLGYCEYNCTLCGQVCPTEAIRKLAIPEKHQFKIGEAYIDQNRCIPYISTTNCIVCEEHCPIPEKAILFEEVIVKGEDGKNVVMKRPKVIEELCIGCGICETKCPVEGKSAIIVTPAGESRRVS